MSKRSTYRSEQEDFEKYFGDGLSEQERHEMERHALEDGFEAEAMEGWDEVPVDTAKTDLADLRKQLQPQKRSFNWFAIAAAVALLVVASWVVLTNLNQQPEMLAQDKSEASPSEEVLSNAKEATPAPTVAEEAAVPEPVEEELPEAIEENLDPETDLVASNESSEPDREVPQNARTTAPILQAKSEVAEELVVADLDVSELEIVESESEPPVQVLSAEDQEAVRYRTDDQVFSVASDDLFKIQSKDDRSYRQIRGSVLDEDGQIVSDAQIVLDGTSILAVSDFSGKFEMAVPDSLVSPSLTFSSTGFSPLNYNITTSDTFDVVMAREDQPNLTTAFLSSRAARKKSDNINIETSDEDDGFPAASPKGGYKKFEKYLKKNTRMPDEAKRQGIKGSVLISFQVSDIGELSEFKVIRGLGYGCDEEAIRVVKEGPLWIPVKSGGQAIEMNTEIEVKFN